MHDPDQTYDGNETVSSRQAPSVVPVASEVPIEERHPHRRYPVRRGWWLMWLATFIAALLRLATLGHPAVVYFDETYYANDAVVYLEGPSAFGDNLDAKYGGKSRENETMPTGGLPGEISWVHPQLGKWIIAAGIALLGKNPWGWRITTGLFGVALVPITYLIAMALWRSHFWSFVSAMLVALDGLAITSSRIAMLDGLVTTFIALALLFAALERRRMEMDAAGSAVSAVPALETLPERADASTYRLDEAEPDHYLSGHRPLREIFFGSKWRVLAGVALGCAVATKWSGAYAMAVVGILFVVWTLTLYGAGWDRVRALVEGIPSLIACLVLIPLAIYLFSYAAFFLEGSHGSLLTDPGRVVSEFVELHQHSLSYHRSLTTEHPYQSSPGSWPLMSRPIAYFYEDGGEAGRMHILAVGNPFIWWPFLAIAPLVLAYGVIRREWQDGFVITSYAGLYFPWFLSSRTAFFYYMAPLVPFIALALISAARRAPREIQPALGVAAVGAAVVGCVLFYPVWTAIPLREDVWSRLMLFSSWV